LAPSFFSIISCTSRTSVRSISDGAMICAFWRNPCWGEFLEVMNAASYLGEASIGKTPKKDPT
jgi:hypothetical protein